MCYCILLSFISSLSKLSLYNGTCMLSNNFINSITFFLLSFLDKCSANFLCLLNILSSFICFLGLTWMNFCHSSISLLDNFLFLFFDASINCIIDLRLTFKFFQFICYFSLFPNFIRRGLLICCSPLLMTQLLFLKLI